MPLTDVGRVAQALNLTEARVHQLVKEGLPREGRGQYDAVKCMLWYIRYLQAVIEKKAVNLGPGEGFAGEREERVRLLRADADLREIELAKERSQLVSIADVEAFHATLVQTAKARMRGIPARIAPELVGEMSRVMIQAKLEKVIDDALTVLAKGPNPSERTG